MGKTKLLNAGNLSVTFRNPESSTTYRVWPRAQNQGGENCRASTTVILPEARPEQE